MNTSDISVSDSAAASVAEAQRANLGAILVGCVIQAVFYGNTFSLAWRYYTVGRRGDPWWFNVSIGAAWILCTFSVAVSVHGLWFFVAQCVFQKTTQTPWTVDFFLLINSVVATIVRLLYVYRLGKLCQTLAYFRGRVLSTIMLVLTGMLCLVEMAASIVISSRLFLTNTAMTGREGPFLEPIFYVLFATGWSADAILTGMMCLWLHNARTGLHRTDSVINNMIVYTIQTGLFPSLVETGGMIAFIIAPQTQIYIAFYIQIGVLYLSSLLTSLNTREFVHQRIKQPLSLNFSILDEAIISDAPTTNRGSSEADAVHFPLDAGRGTPPTHTPVEHLDEKAVTAGVER